MPMAPPLPVALTVAGSDSGGGAGIQADLKTFHQFGVFGTSVVTAITAQNTCGVTDVCIVPDQTVTAQFDAVASDLRPTAFKTGMLATDDSVHAVAEAVLDHEMTGFVMDPVMVSTSGHRLLDPEAEITLIRELLPLCDLVTPNLHEASIMVRRTVKTVSDMRVAARALVDAGAGAALVKGGHLDGAAVDLFWDGSTEQVWTHARIDTPHTHGTGCTLSAAITAGLAAGQGLQASVERAVHYVAAAIATAPGLGRCNGPINHFADPDQG